MIGLGHPSLKKLSRFEEGELSAEATAHVREHLADCTRCRRELSFFRDCAEAASEMPAPRPPINLLQRVESRRQAGACVILPVEPPSPTSGRELPRSLVAVAAAVLALVLAGVFLLPSGKIHAGLSELEVLGDASFGRVWTVEYRTVGELAAEERLRLRGFSRRPAELAGLPGAPFEAVLEHRGDGRFRAQVRLPATSVQALLTVEDMAGERLDTNAGQMWEILETSGDGHPSLNALWESLRGRGVISKRSELDVARRITELYPDRPEGWYARLTYESTTTPEDVADSLRAFHRLQLARLDRLHSGRDSLDADLVGAMAWYAQQTGATEVHERWNARLQREHPDQRNAVSFRAVELFYEPQERARQTLEALNAEWERYGARYEIIPGVAFAVALHHGDPELVRRWAERYRSARPDLEGDIARRAARLPDLRQTMATWLRADARALSRIDDRLRPLHMSRSEQRRKNILRRASTLAALGEVLLAEGRAEAALDTLSLASARGWNPQLFREIAHLRMEADDVSGAARTYALAAVDPLAASEWRSMPERLQPLLTDVSWRARLQEAREEFRRRMMRDALDDPLPAPLSVRDREGEVRPFTDLLGRQATLVVYAPLEHTEIRTVAGHERPLRNEGVRVLVVAYDPEYPREPPPAFDPPFPVVRDHAGEVADVVGWRHPSYLVIDAGGRLRFRPSEPETAVRQAIVLAREARAHVVE